MSARREVGWVFLAALLGVISAELAACGGKSGGNHAGGGTSAAGSAGTAAESGMGDGATGGDGTGGGNGSTAGMDGGTSSGAGRTSAGAAGQWQGGNAGSGPPMSAGTAGSGVTPGAGCDYDGVHYESGADWPVDCNRCFCEEGEVACTTRICSPASGGMGGVAGSGTAGSTGAGGAQPTPEDCALDVGSLCIEGTPTDGGDQLEVGMPLVLTLRPEGCFSSSCTQLVSFDCNTIGSEHDFYVTGFFCVTSEGDACTDDCGGAPEATCDLGTTLTEGEYTIGLSGRAGAMLSSLRFTVPGVVLERDRCTHPL
jgi:hypothetical protein